MWKKFIVIMAALAVVSLSAGAQEPVTLRATAPDPAGVTLEPVHSINRPLFITHAGDGSQRLFIVSQGGIVDVVQPDGSASVFLDMRQALSWDVNAGGYTERGLLGLAFSPNFAQDGVFYVNYTGGSGGTVVSRFSVSADDPNRADPASESVILRVDQPFPNHNGGMIAFGPDGYLYIGLGDGGSANDPLGAGQRLDTLLGKILRVDVSSGEGYTVPADNPFVGQRALPEIWAYGLRNPWRFSFDRATGDLYIADVGQNRWEEVIFQPAESAGGENYGWVAYEGTTVFNRNVSAPNAVMPFVEYEHGAAGYSDTGGDVRRGEALPDLQGVYFYGDWGSGNIWAAWRDTAGAWQNMLFLATDFNISSFGEDEAGELYVADHNGTVYRFSAP